MHTERRTETDRIEVVRDILDNFHMSRKLSDEVVLVRDGGAYTLVGIAYLDGTQTLINGLDRDQQGYLADRLSKKGRRYRLLPLQKTYDLIYGDIQLSGPPFKGNRFYHHIVHRHDIYNLERIRRPNLVFPDSNTTIRGGRFSYSGTPVELEINVDDVWDTLERAGVVQHILRIMIRGNMWFDNNDESAISSYIDESGQFAFFGNDPVSARHKSVVVFEKLDEEVKQPEKVTIGKDEYDALLEDSRKLKSLTS